MPHATADLDSSLVFHSRLERVQANDRTALGELFAEHGDMVFRAALRLTGSRADADDVTQELFVRLPGAVRGFTGTSANCPGWLRRVAVRQALMHLRGGRRRRSDEYRTVFLLKEVEGYDHVEIAELLRASGRDPW